MSAKRLDKTNIIRTIIIIFLFAWLPSTSFSQKPIIKDLKSDWSFYDSESNAYLPYVDGLTRTETIHFSVDFNQFEDHALDLRLGSGLTVLIEDRVVFVSSKRGHLEWNIDSLKRILDLEQARISLYSNDLKLDSVETAIVDINSSNPMLQGSSGLAREYRNTRTNYDFYIISILFILVFGLYVKRTLKSVFFDYFSFGNAFSIRPKTEAIFGVGIFSSTNIMMIFLYSVCMGFSITVLLDLLTDFLKDWFGSKSSIQMIQAAFILSLISAVMMFAKYFLLHALSGIFKLRRFLSNQYFDYLRLTLFITSVVFLLAVFSVSTDGFYLKEFPGFFLTLLVLLLLLRPLFIYLKLNKFSSYKNLHLFSYLCGTEIIPLIIIIKFFLY